MLRSRCAIFRFGDLLNADSCTRFVAHATVHWVFVAVVCIRSARVNGLHRRRGRRESTSMGRRFILLRVCSNRSAASEVVFARRGSLSTRPLLGSPPSPSVLTPLLRCYVISCCNMFRCVSLFLFSAILCSFTRFSHLMARLCERSR